jgi:pSer/pThr/pTyr-binding forkhead associated (FHA) protein
MNPPFLVFHDGDGVERTLVLTGARLSVGRAEGTDLRLAWDPQISRLHAILERFGESWTVLDEGLSRNGTLVNGTRVQGRRRLADGDLISFGSTQVDFRDPAEQSDETRPASATAGAAGLTVAQKRVLVALCRPLLGDPHVAGAPPANAEMATALNVSTEAVRSQMKSLFRLFEVPDLPQNRKRAELARRALAAGAVTPRDL